MSKTAIDVAKILYQHLKYSVLMNDDDKPNGELCLYQRPLNSEAEDVVINTLPISKREIQVGMGNVNLYVPNLKILDAEGNVIDSTQPNMIRLSHLANLANQALGDVWNYDGSYNFSLESDHIIPDDNNQHYINCRVEILIVNI